jgi:hypothetical protein
MAATHFQTKTAGPVFTEIETHPGLLGYSALKSAKPI